MGNGTSTGQGNYTTYGSRDVGRAVEQGQQHWPSELAEASNLKKSNLLFSSYQKPHIMLSKKSKIFSFDTLVLFAATATAAADNNNDDIKRICGFNFM